MTTTVDIKTNLLKQPELKQKILSSVQKQEIWRQTQINIFYKIGRPIYLYNEIFECRYFNSAIRKIKPTYPSADGKNKQPSADKEKIEVRRRK